MRKFLEDFTLRSFVLPDIYIRTWTHLCVLRPKKKVTRPCAIESPSKTKVSDYLTIGRNTLWCELEADKVSPLEAQNPKLGVYASAISTSPSSFSHTSDMVVPILHLTVHMDPNAGLMPHQHHTVRFSGTRLQFRHPTLVGANFEKNRMPIFGALYKWGKCGEKIEKTSGGWQMGAKPRCCTSTRS